MDYTISDMRPIWMRRRLPRHSDTPDEDDLDAEAERRAAVQSAYTPSKGDALDPSAEAPPPEYENRLVMENRLRAAEHSRQRRDRVEQEVRDQVRDFALELRHLAIRMVRAGVDPDALFADFQRQLRERQEELRTGRT